MGDAGVIDLQRLALDRPRHQLRINPAGPTADQAPAGSVSGGKQARPASIRIKPAGRPKDRQDIVRPPGTSDRRLG